MKRREHRDYFHDILDSINDIISFTEGMSFEIFKIDKKTQYAVIRCIEIIGEATQKIPGSIRDKYPSVPWQKMSGMRNKLIHEYFGIDIQILWETVKKDIPYLKPLVDKIITDN